jgi:hypothetical protein
VSFLSANRTTSPPSPSALRRFVTPFPLPSLRAEPLLILVLISESSAASLQLPELPIERADPFEGERPTLRSW